MYRDHRETVLKSKYWIACFIFFEESVFIILLETVVTVNATGSCEQLLILEHYWFLVPFLILFLGKNNNNNNKPTTTHTHKPPTQTNTHTKPPIQNHLKRWNTPVSREDPAVWTPQLPFEKRILKTVEQMQSGVREVNKNKWEKKSKKQVKRERILEH